MQLKNKLFKLQKILEKSGSCLVAFSGGVDSAFLLKNASLVLPKGKIMAVTANSATYPGEELLFARQFCRRLGLRHKIINTGELHNKSFVANPPERCYFCKKELFTQLRKIAEKNKLNFVFDAANISDKSDFRPGERAKKELGARSPLQEAGLTKADIRSLSKKLGLETWNKPAQACLASRIPYGTPISKPALERIGKAENILKALKFQQVRVRHYNGLCRIEVGKNEVGRLINNRQSIVDKFKKLGYNYITVDLEGYRAGSLNEVIGR